MHTLGKDYQNMIPSKQQGGKTITSIFEHAVSDTFILIISERAPLVMTYISMSPKVIWEENCEGAKRPSGEGMGGGKFCIWSPKKQFLMHIFWAKITRIIMISSKQQGGKTITSSFEHAVSDTFILILSERAHLKMTYIFHYSESNLRGELRGSEATERGKVWEGVPSQGRENFAF